MKNLNFLLLTLIFGSCASQNIGITKSTIFENSTPQINLPASTIEGFTLSNDLTPITLQVNVIVLEHEQKKHSNFDLNNPEEKSLLMDYFEKTNEAWSKFYQPNELKGCYTGTDFYDDSKIRFKFNYITYKDSKAWNYKNSGANIEAKKMSGITPSENWYLHYLDEKFANDPTIPKGINVYLTMDGENFDQYASTQGKGYNISGIEAAQLPSSSNLSRSSSVHIPNRYLKYLSHRYQAPIEFNTTWKETRNWHLNDAKGSSHEFGHTLGLQHSNQYHGSNQCKFALMSQVGADPRNYVQPTELLKAHKNLRESNLMQFATEDSFLGNTFLIDQSKNWTKTQRFYSNLKLADQVILTIEKPIILSPQAKIEFGNNAKIILTKEGKITFPNGKEFTNYVNKKADSLVKN